MLGLVEAHDLVFLLDAQPHGLVEDKGQDQGDDEGIGAGCHNSNQLNHELLGIAGYQAGGTDRCKHTGEDGAEGTADAVYAEGIQGIVVFQFGLEHDAAIADQAGCSTHQQGRTRLYETCGRGDHDQTGHNTGTEAEGAGLAGVDPFSDHPGEAGSSRGNGGGGACQTGQPAGSVRGIDTHDGRTGVETEPAEPEQTDSQQGEGQIVGSHALLGESV